MEKQNVKDLILVELQHQERPLAWLSRKTQIKYGTLYGILIHRIIVLTDDNLAKINKVLGTDFSND